MTTKMKEYIFDRKTYLRAGDLYESYPHCFPGCSRSERAIVDKKNIDKSKCVYKKYVDGKWINSTEEYNRAKLFIEAEVIYDIVGNSTPKYQDAPELCQLNDDEYFRDSNGNIIEIETRGEKTMGGIYFKVVDIERGFGLNNIVDTLYNQNSTFIRDVHFSTFTVKNNKKILNPITFFTFQGLIKYIGCSRLINSNILQEWIYKLLQSNKIDNVIISKIRGPKNDNIISCVYLFKIGKMSDLFDESIYDDDEKLYKYGMTSNLKKRTKEHQKLFGKKFGSIIFLDTYSVINNEYLPDAEYDLKIHVSQHKFKYENMKELIVLNEDSYNKIKDFFVLIYNKYSHMDKIIKENTDVELTKKTHEIEMLKKEIEAMKIKNDTLQSKNTALLLENNLLKRRQRKK